MVDKNDGPAVLRVLLLQAPALCIAQEGVITSHRLPAKDGALLALLLLDGPQMRRAVVALLWPEKDVSSAHNNLRQRLFRLRRLVGRELVHNAATLTLAEGLSHDLDEPQQALRQDPQALQGPLLGQQRYDDSPELAAWVAAAREQWRARLREALTALATERESQGRLADALAYAARLVNEEPLLEHGVRLLMRLHYRRGDRGAALAAYERCVQALHQQLGESPSDETSALAQEIGRGDVEGLARVRPVPLALRHPPRLIGREATLLEAQRLWQRSGVVLLSGPAGIGKTRVFDELLVCWDVKLVCRLQPDDARTDLRLLGRIAAALLQLAGQDWGEAGLGLRWLADPLGQPAPPGAMHGARLQALLQEALGRARDLTALAIDDLHFADADSVAVLCRLLPESATGPCWLLSCRDRELPPALTDWLRVHEAELPLPPLDPQQQRMLLESMALPELPVAECSALLHAHCGGHPLSLLQVLRALHDSDALACPPARLPVPRDVMRRVARWLDEGEPQAQQLAFVAALSAGDFSIELARLLLNASAAELLRPWRQLESLNVFKGEGFSHELMRQAVLESVPVALAPTLHRDIAAALQRLGAAPARVAVHWEAGGEPRSAAQAHQQAAEQSLAAGLEAKAMDLLAHAALLYDSAGQQAQAFDCRWRAGRLLLSADSAEQALDAAVALIAAACTPQQAAAARCLLAQVRYEQHDATALAEAREAVALAQACAEPALLARARLAEAAALQLLDRHGEALALLSGLDAGVLGVDERHSVDDARARALASLGRRSESLAMNRSALQQALADGELSRAAEQAGSCAIQLGYLCRSDEALAFSEQAVALSRRTGVERGFLLVDEMGLAGGYMDAGRFSEALSLSERVVTELRAVGYLGWALNAENMRSALFLQLGRTDLAQQLLPDAPQNAPTWARAMRSAAQARLAQARGHPALPGLRRAMELLGEGGALLNPYVRARLELELGRWSSPGEALARALHCRQWAATHEHTALGRLAAMVEIEARLRLGQQGLAADCADVLEAEFADCWQCYGFSLPELWWTLCLAWDAGDQGQRGSRMAAEAAQWLRNKASRQVPALFQDSFLQRNPVHRAILERAGSQ